MKKSFIGATCIFVFANLWAGQATIDLNSLITSNRDDIVNPPSNSITSNSIGMNIPSDTSAEAVIQRLKNYIQWLNHGLDTPFPGFKPFQQY